MQRYKVLYVFMCVGARFIIDGFHWKEVESNELLDKSFVYLLNQQTHYTTQ